ncbi:MAG: transporter [Bacteroidales bacterium]|nr:transporter [Bacteroidales bacterium]
MKLSSSSSSFALWRQRLKPWMLPISMLGGVLLHDFIDLIAFVAPYLIFVMLLITYCKIRPQEIRLTSLSGWLLLIQVGGGIGLYYALLPLGEDIAQGTFICVFCPTATAAPVITGMLGGSVARLATFSLISNLAVALLAPFLFTMMGSQGVQFGESLYLIASRVVPLILGPLAVAFMLRATLPRAHQRIATKQSWSFYIWAVSLFIVVGRAVSFVMSEPADRIPEMVAIALCSLLVCCGQFYAGRRIGARCGDRIAGAQGLGQKNTVLAIWMALTYLNPIASIGPAAYVAWQNTINSLQLYYHQRRQTNT